MFNQAPMKPIRIAWCFVPLLLVARVYGQPEPVATYSADVGPLIERKCVHCHRPGGVAPTPFMSYAEVRSWAKQSYTPLDALLRTRAMPPWPADPNVGEFTNREFMTQAEIDLLLRWIAAGYPRGDGGYEGPATPGEWEEGEPDQVLELPEYTVPESVRGEIRTVLIPTNLPEDRWIIATEVRPGNAYAVRGIFGGTVGAFQPGQSVTRYGPPFATRLRQGDAINVDVHYFKDEGVAETDQSRIGLHFAEGAGSWRAVSEAPMRADAFTIPAGKAGFEVSVSFTFPEDGDVLALMPNLHERGKRVAYVLRMPDGSERRLLEIPEWNPKWKYRYVLREPIAAPKGSVVLATATFDNSEANLKNPDPWSAIESGPAGETFEGWLSYAIADAPR
jgi:hypothetical protein